MKNASAGTFRSALVALGRRRGAAWSIGAAVVAAVAILARLGWARRLDRRTRGTEPGVYADDGVLLHTVMEGSADAPLTVVFAHGFAARLAEYDDQRDALRERARLVLFDQRGHGDSGWGSFRSISIDRLGRDLGCVIDQVAGPAPVVLVAHSMGGMAALALAARRPELFGSRIAGVALLSTAAGQLPRVELPGWTARVALRSGAALLFAWWLWFVAPAVNAFAPFRRRWGRRWLKRHLFGLEQPPPSAVSRMEDMWTNTAQSMAAAFYPRWSPTTERRRSKCCGRFPLSCWREPTTRRSRSPAASIWRRRSGPARGLSPFRGLGTW